MTNTPDDTPTILPPSAAGTITLMDRLLRKPHDLASEIINNPVRTTIPLCLLTAFFYLAYGLIVGAFSGGAHFWQAPWKVLFIVSASAAICFPSLHIILCLQGGNQTFGQTFAQLLVGLSLTGLLLIGLAPVVWVFSQSTNSAAFMGLLHWCFALFSLHFGLRFIKQGMGMAGHVLPPRSFALWVLIFVMVVMQMSTTHRPLLTSVEGDAIGQKVFFLNHWIDFLRHGGHR